MSTIKPGDYVRVEHTLGIGDSAQTHLVEGVAFLDAEGIVRVSHSDSDWEVNLSTDERGYYRRGVVVLSVESN